MIRKPIFFTADWHVSHENSIKFDKRPFANLEEMHEGLIKRYNATVPKNGLCYFLGDMGNCSKTLKKVMDQLNGTKVLLLGNHDKGSNTMYNCGFDVVLNVGFIIIAKQRVSFSHCPLLGVFREDTTDMRGANIHIRENWHGESRQKHRNCSIEDLGQYHLSGHIHSRKDKKVSEKILGKQYDVGVTANNYTPVSISSIESWIVKNLEKEKWQK